MVGQRTLADLKRECATLGLEVKCPTAKNGKLKENKKYFIDALRAHYIKVKYPDGKIPRHLELICSIESLMLADRIYAKPEPLQKQIWDSPDWGFQEKMNGCRMAVVFVRGEGLHFYSRGVSVEDFLPVEYFSIWIPDREKVEAYLDQQFDSFIIDDEVICTNPHISTVLGNRGVVTETMLQAVSALLSLNPEESIRIQQEEKCPLRFCTFDCFYLEGKWLDEDNAATPQTEREKASMFIVNMISAMGVNICHLSTVYDPALKKQFYDEIIANRGEGVIAKHKDALYRAVEARSRNLWVKIKRSVGQSLTETEYNDTLDAFVSSYGLGEEGKGYENLVGWIGFSVMLVKPDGTREPHEIARCSAIELEFRKKITTVGDDGKPCMIAEMYNTVATIDGQAVSARSNRLSHARILEWRTDKVADQCELHEEFMKSMIM